MFQMKYKYKVHLKVFDQLNRSNQLMLCKRWLIVKTAKFYSKLVKSKKRTKKLICYWYNSTSIVFRKDFQSNNAFLFELQSTLFCSLKLERGDCYSKLYKWQLGGLIVPSSAQRQKLAIDVQKRYSYQLLSRELSCHSESIQTELNFLN